MLHNVLFLLKLIGIILASILALLLFLILVVLLVPIRYRVNADAREEIRAEAKLSWLFRILYIRILYSDNKLRIVLRIFGRIFYDSSNLNRNKQPKKSGRLGQFQKPAQKAGMKTELKSERKVNVQNDIKSANENKKAADITSIQRDRGKPEEKADRQSAVIPAEIPKEQKDMVIPGSDRNIADKKIEVNRYGIPGEPSGPEDSLEEFQSEKPKGIIGRIKRILHKMKEFFRGIKEGFLRMKDQLRNLKENIATISEKWDKIKAFLKDELNKEAFKKTFHTLKRIFKHVRPAKLEMELEFGTGDPCSTGQVLGVMAIFYGFYGKSVRIIPNFEEEILKGSIFCMGRIRLSTLLIICIQLILDKNFRNLLKNFKTLKEDL